ncbi:hypothetical protein, partial [Mesorhizobium sp.]|uniref:hypothetical protein n=1 Tax=Mesorhizobium sp. TaxID=1871066 RepID=UPI00257EE5D5
RTALFLVLSPSFQTICDNQKKDDWESQRGHIRCKYVAGEWKVAEVTGIHDYGQNRIADYLIKSVPTDAGKIFRAPDEQVAKQAMFVKYDDGWRLMR